MTTAREHAADAGSRGLLASARRLASRIGARFSPAPITWQRPKAGGETNITALQVERERLIADLREARRKHRSTCELTARIRAITIEILKGAP